MSKSSRRKKIRRTGEQPNERIVNLSPAMGDQIRNQFDLFKEKFGREIGPNDPVVFDPDENEPVRLSSAKAEAEVVDVMRKIGIDDAYIYAYQMTGLLPTEENIDLLNEDDYAEFTDAFNLYKRNHPPK